MTRAAFRIGDVVAYAKTEDMSSSMRARVRRHRGVVTAVTPHTVQVRWEPRRKACDFVAYKPSLARELLYVRERIGAEVAA